MENINEAKSCFLENTNKIDKPFERLIKKNSIPNKQNKKAKRKSYNRYHQDTQKNIIP